MCEEIIFQICSGFAVGFSMTIGASCAILIRNECLRTLVANKWQKTKSEVQSMDSGVLLAVLILMVVIVAVVVIAAVVSVVSGVIAAEEDQEE